jgi:tyrosine-protein kinase Etk/Wzc
MADRTGTGTIEIENGVTLTVDPADLDSEEPETGIGFLPILTILAIRHRLIGLFILVGLVVGVGVAFVLPNQYTATTKILPPEAGQSAAVNLPNSLNGLGMLALLGKDLPVKNPNELYVGILKSRPIADSLIHRFGLQTVYRKRDMTGTREKLADATDIVAEKNGLIRISVEDRSKKRASDLANAYVEELRNLTRGLAITEASQRRFFYEQQLGEAKEDLANAEINLKHAEEKTGIVHPDAQAKAIIDAIARARANIAAKRVEIEAMRSFATEQSPQMIIARRELAAMQSELSALEKQSGEPGSYEVALKDVPDASVIYIRAVRELRYRETLFELLAKQFEAAKLDEARSSMLIQVVEGAVEPDRKSSPYRIVITFLFALTGCFFACCFVLFKDWFDRLQADPMRGAELARLRGAVHGRSAK